MVKTNNNYDASSITVLEGLERSEERRVGKECL